MASFDNSVVFEKPESLVLCSERMNGSLCQPAVNTQELTGSTYKEHGQQQLRKKNVNAHILLQTPTKSSGVYQNTHSVIQLLHAAVECSDVFLALLLC